MICPKCRGENFILEITTITMDKYKIFKNGRVTKHPIKETAAQDMADNDSLIRCLGCKTGYILPHNGRTELLLGASTIAKLKAFAKEYGYY